MLITVVVLGKRITALYKLKFIEKRDELPRTINCSIAKNIDLTVR